MNLLGALFQKRLVKKEVTAPSDGSELAAVERRVTQYLDDIDQGKLVYPAYQRNSGDVDGDVRSIWDHTRLEAMRYLVAVPGRGFQLLDKPARQPELLDTFLRQRPHEDIVIDFTVSTESNLAIAATAGFNWLNHCATITGANRDKFSGTLSHFRKLLSLAQKWWEMEGANVRCDRMLHEQQTAPLVLNLIWLEYTRLSKEVASAAVFGSSIKLETDPRLRALDLEFGGRSSELAAPLVEVAESVIRFHRALCPEDLISDVEGDVSLW